MYEVRHDTVRANGIRFHIASTGDAKAPLLLLLHGFPECWYSWRHQLEALANRFHCVAPDLRGYGDTDKPKGGYDLANLAKDAAELIRALGHERAFVAGHDWGGAITWDLVRRHPGVVEKFAVLNCPPSEILLREVQRNFRQFRRSWYIYFFQLPFLPERRLTKNEGAIIPRIFLSGATRRDAFHREELTVFRESILKPGAARGALAYYRSAHKRKPLPREPIRVPGLLLWGKDDPFLGIELTHRVDRLMEAPLTKRYIDRCGHWTQQEAPQEVNEALREFLATSGE
jgi:pimeloyl-ACP methyl ester carboxylesterase